jgi:hypothetical protein
MLGAAFVVSRSLWLPIGIHLGWNAATVAIFGTNGSGAGTRDALLQAQTHGPVWLTGGPFGPEAGLIAVAVCTVVTVVLLLAAHRKNRIVSWNSRRLSPALPTADPLRAAKRA